MVDLARVLPRGQLTLPRAIRRATGVKPRDVPTVRVVGPGTIELRTVKQLTLAEALERYCIETPIDEARDRERWEAEAARHVFGTSRAE
jgi:bifunctional DNA-binding transcriptional regulator/antitoxin component of YhaV-PrlF toxin-antitoxin module